METDKLLKRLIEGENTIPFKGTHPYLPIKILFTEEIYE
jgi:hypothetical protein